MFSSSAIRVENLTKAYGRGKSQVQAVRGLNLDVQTRQVYGFLGPNGAGKSTTIRMILGLIRPTSGDVYVYGQSSQSAQNILRQRVGALVEGAMFYNFLTGRANLEVLAHTGNYHDPHRIDLLLEALGLTQHAEKRVKTYSTGMKQRLGIAAALLGDPDLVILDEPTNGLDPNGIREIRLFIRQLVDEHGKTVFLSSHLLNEIEQVCDRVAIINHGEVVREGLVSELLAGQHRIRVQAEPFDRARRILSRYWDTLTNGRWITVNTQREESPRIVQKLAEGQVAVYQIVEQRRTLEDYFLSVTR